MPRPTIVCVDDEKVILDSLKDQLEDAFGAAYSIEIAQSGEECLELLLELSEQGVAVPVLVSDHLMPGMRGDELMVAVQQLNPQIRKILLTGQASAEAVGRALNTGGLYRYVQKPWVAEDLRQTIEQAALSFAQERELSERLTILQHLRQMLEQVQAVQGLPQLVPALLLALLQQTGARGGQLALPTAAAEPFVQGQCDGPTHHWDVQMTDGTAAELTLWWSPDAPATPAQQELAHLVSQQVGPLLANAQLYDLLEARIAERTATIDQQNRDIQDSLRYAGRIQEAILPAQQDLARALPTAATLYEPAEKVSGDFYYFFQRDGLLYLGLADCPGLGVPAALMAVLGHSALEFLVKDAPAPPEPARVLLGFAEHLYSAAPEQQPELAQLAVLQLQPHADGLLLHLAANGCAVWWAENGKLELLVSPERTASDPLGLQRVLRRGGRLILHTPGISSQPNVDGNPVPVAKWEAWLRNSLEKAPDAQIAAVRQELRAYRGMAPQHDDYVLMVLPIA